MKTILKYDFYHLRKTAKFIIFPVVMIILAMLSPLTARYMNELLAMFIDEGMNLTFPDPTVIDSYNQFVGNLSDMYLFLIVFIAVGYFISDKTKGLYPLILSKPIDRKQYLLAKYFTLNTLIFGSLLIGSIFFSYYTFVLFGEVSIGGVLSIVGLFMIFTLFITSVAMFMSMIASSYMIAIILTFAMYFFIMIFNAVNLAFFTYFPGHIFNQMMYSVSGTLDGWLLVWNIVIVFALTTITIILSIIRFRDYDLQ